MPARRNMTLKDGTIATDKDLLLLKDKAKKMYLIDGMSPNKIAGYLGPTPVTIGKWRKAGKWDDVRNKAQNQKEKILLKQLTKGISDTAQIDEEYVLSGLRDLANNARAETVQLGAWKALGEYLNMFDDEDTDAANQDTIVFEIEEDKQPVLPAPEPDKIVLELHENKTNTTQVPS